MFEDIVNSIKDDVKKDIDLYTGKDVRPFGSYRPHELKKLPLTTIVKSLKMSWDQLGKEQQEAREAQSMEYNMEAGFVQKAKNFFDRNKRKFVVGFNLALVGVSAGLNLNYFANNGQMLPEGQDIITPIVEKIQSTIQQERIDEMEQPVVTVGEHETTITDKATEHEEFKAELQEGVVQEEELTQEQLEERAEINQEKTIEDSQVKESQEVNIDDVVR